MPSSQSVLRDSMLRRTVTHTGDYRSFGKRRRVKQKRPFFGTLPTGDGNAVSTSGMSLRIGTKQVDDESEIEQQIEITARGPDLIGPRRRVGAGSPWLQSAILL